jgi:ribonuclease H / adenosylcobalamin/alpha-ribazole phosphatase
MGQLIEAWFDGVCEDVNPGGHAAYGVLVKVDGKEVFHDGKFVLRGPNASNNVAEYAGFCAAVDWILNQNLLGVTIIRGDSKLVIMQMKGAWKVHGGYYVPYYNKAKHLLSVLQERTENNVSLEWIPRKKNGECDRYSKDVLLRMGVKFRIQPEPTKTCR